LKRANIEYDIFGPVKNSKLQNFKQNFMDFYLIVSVGENHVQLSIDCVKA